MDAHVYAALASGDLTIEQMNEFTLHFAVYCGWPKASQLEMTVRSQWQRLHEERGQEAPALPDRDETTSGSPILGSESHKASSASRRSTSSRRLRRTRRTSTPASSTSSSVTSGCARDSPGASAVSSRFPASACRKPSDRSGHTSPPPSDQGTCRTTEMEALIAHFGTYAGEIRARSLFDVARQWQADRS